MANSDADRASKAAKREITQQIRSALLEAQHAERALRPFKLSGRGHEPRVVLDVATAAMVRSIHLAHVSISGFGANNRYPARVFDRAVQLLEARQMHAAAKTLEGGFRWEYA